MTRVQEKQAIRRQEIIDSIAPLLAEKSFDELSVEDICKASGISIGSFYHYFEKKSDILVGLFNRIDSYMEENAFPLMKKRDEIDNIKKSAAKKEEHYSGKLRIQCFGNFEVFGENGIVRFSRSLSKEALAYLVDRRGAGCTVGEICSVLWEDRTADKALKSQCRVILGSLKKDLEQAGAGDVIVKYWNTWGIDTDKVKCDYYAFLRKDSDAVNSFRGEYMVQYSWAEMTVGRLYNITQDEII